MTSTSAGDDTMEMEALGGTADQHGDDADAGAHMDGDDDEESGVLWVTVRNHMRIPIVSQLF